MAIDFWHWEEVLEDVHQALTEFTGEVVEDQMGVGLGNSFDFLIDVMS